MRGIPNPYESSPNNDLVSIRRKLRKLDMRIKFLNLKREEMRKDLDSAKQRNKDYRKQYVLNKKNKSKRQTKSWNKQDLKKEIVFLLSKHPFLNRQEILNTIGCSEWTMYRGSSFKELLSEGMVRATIGPIKKYYLINTPESELLCKKQLNPIEEKELNTAHNSTFV